MANRDLIVIGASAGGIEALRDVFAGLPSDLPAAVLVVLHMPAEGGTALKQILSRATTLRVDIAAEGDTIWPGRVYVCRGDFHLLAGHGHLHVRRGPREHGHRPAIDALFRSAAAYYGPRTVGVVLSGTLNDGTAGLYTIRSMGGLGVVQNPEDALYDGMPRSALEYVGADYVSDSAKMGALLGRLASEEIPDAGGLRDPEVEQEARIVEGKPTKRGDDRPRWPSPWPCPDCAGVLWEIEDGPILRFRCRVGHAWAAETLLEQQSDGIEGAVWMALRALEDRAALSRRLAEGAEVAGRAISASRYRQDLVAMDRNIDLLTRLLSVERSDDDAAEGAAGEGNGLGG